MNRMTGERPNIVFVMLDTARADYFRAYGGRLGLPNIDRLCSKASIYENAVSPGTYTAPSHVSLFLGKRVRGVKSLMVDKMRSPDRNTDPFLEKERLIKRGEMTLAKKLSYLGYDTAIFSNNPLVTEYTGITEGFSYLSYSDNVFVGEGKVNKKASIKAVMSLIANDNVRNRLIDLSCAVGRAIPRGRFDKVYLDLRMKLNRIYFEESNAQAIDQGANLTNLLVDKYLKRAGTGNNFMFINYMEAHEGYPTDLVSDEYVDQDKWLYLGGILDHEGPVKAMRKACDRRLKHLDSQIGMLMARLKESGMLDNTVLVFSGDHGQGFMEHGQMFHSMFPYREISRIPLVAARFVNGRQVDTRERVKEPVSLTALHGCLLDIAYNRIEMVDGSLRRDEFVFSDHTGITEVWDEYLLGKVRGRSRCADAIYRAKLRHNTFATAIHKGDYKLIHYRNGRMGDELYNVAEDPGETVNLIGNERKRALAMLHADGRAV